MEYNTGRRGPPSSQYDFTKPDDSYEERPISSKGARRDLQSQIDDYDPNVGNIHGREFNMARRG